MNLLRALRDYWRGCATLPYTGEKNTAYGVSVVGTHLLTLAVIFGAICLLVRLVDMGVLDQRALLDLAGIPRN